MKIIKCIIFIRGERGQEGLKIGKRGNFEILKKREIHLKAENFHPCIFEFYAYYEDVFCQIMCKMFCIKAISTKMKYFQFFLKKI